MSGYQINALKQINNGLAPDDGSGDSLRTGAETINNNFDVTRTVVNSQAAVDEITVQGNGLVVDTGSGATLLGGSQTLNTNSAALAQAVNNLAASQAAGTTSYLTLAALNADLTPADGVVAYVTNDPTIANNGWYRKNGASGTGTWGATVNPVSNALTAALGNPAGFQQSGTGSVLRTFQDKSRETYSINDVMPVGGPVSDIGPYLQQAIVNANALNKPLKLTADAFAASPMLTPVVFTGAIEIVAESGVIIDGTGYSGADLITLGGSAGAMSPLSSDVAKGSLTIATTASLAAGDSIQITTHGAVGVDARAAVLNLSGTTTGIVSVSASAAIFTANDVGRAIISNASNACMKILSYVDSSHVTAWISDYANAPSTTLAQGTWYINELFNATRPYYYKGELCNVLSVSGTTVTLDAPLLDSYSAAYTYVRKMVMPRVHVDGFTIKRNTNNGRALVISYANDVLVNSVSAYGARNALIALDTVNVAYVSNCAGKDFWYAGTGTSYGLSVSSSQNIIEIGNSFLGGRHAIAHGGNEPCRNVQIIGNTLAQHPSANAPALDFHGNAEGVLLTGNSIAGAGFSCRNVASSGNSYKYTGSQSVDGVLVFQEIDSDYYIFDDVISTTAPSSAIGVNYSPNVANLKTKNLSVNGNISNYGGGTGIHLYPRAVSVVGCTIDNVSFGGYTSAISAQAILVINNSPALLGIANLSISGRQVSSSGDGVYLEADIGSGDVLITSSITGGRAAGVPLNVKGGFRNVKINGASIASSAASSDRCYLSNTGTLSIGGGTSFTGFTAVELSTAGPTDVIIGDTWRENNLPPRIATPTAQRTYTSFSQSGARTLYGTAAPTVNTWSKGDRCFNSAPAVGSPKSWVCTVSGAPGTWVSEGNL